jgi:hypothetical protein
MLTLKSCWHLTYDRHLVRQASDQSDVVHISLNRSSDDPASDLF